MATPTERLAEALGAIGVTAELMTVTEVRMSRHAEVPRYGDPVTDEHGQRFVNPQFGDIIETLNIRYRGQLRPAAPTSTDTEADDDAEPANTVRLAGDWADVLTELIRRARPKDRIEIAPTGMASPGITLGLGTDWLAEARELAEDMLGRRLVQVTTWVLED
jgi:hypothetical protein